MNLFYFNRLFQMFALMDGDNDRRLDINEFRKGVGLLDMDTKNMDLDAEFKVSGGSTVGLPPQPKN